MPRLRRSLALGLSLSAACGGGESAIAPYLTITAPPAVQEPTVPQIATVATPFTYDATCAGRAFTDPKGGGLTYTVTFSPSANGLVASNGRLGGAPATAGIVTARIVATDVKGDTASQTFTIVAFAAGLPSPTLPEVSFSYSDATSPIPRHFTGPGLGGAVNAADNTPLTNPATDAGATLGRVLFHDVRLSANDRVACSSCHIQAFGFADTARLSVGFNGGRTARHSMALANARFYAPGRFFWDERGATLEDQVLQPIQDAVEMGLTLSQLETKVRLTAYYPPLFLAAFGSSDVTSDRIARALAQYVRSIVSGGSRYDAEFTGRGGPDFSGFTEQERAGQQLFIMVGCAQCHTTNAQISDSVHNTGLDATITDAGAGGGRFKAPSLRNVAVRAPYMHDGRFQTLEQVVDFYADDVRANPNLDQRLRGRAGAPRRLNLDRGDREALVAFLRTFTDSALLTAAKHSDPFRRR
jgi:cytochrome c peroxidase